MGTLHLARVHMSDWTTLTDATTSSAARAPILVDAVWVHFTSFKLPTLVQGRRTLWWLHFTAMHPHAKLANTRRSHPTSMPPLQILLFCTLVPN